ncbi:MAG TPA: polyphenol oxidase family protein [Gemmatimonadaceae bacterium]|jgi:YfiH family protein|nr:polyphenol oxidase family protein [Gemmatimonadaceae bacterium]
MSATQEGRGAKEAQPIPREVVPDLEALGLHAFTTTRAAGTFGTGGSDPVSEVMARWNAIISELRPVAPRFATAGQVHGKRVITHTGGWEGWLRVAAADGHLTTTPGTAFAVTVADCVPVFMAHPSGAIALLHSGWRGTAERITERAIAIFHSLGRAPADLHLHLGPSICGACYEVSPDVFARLTSRTVTAPTPVDLRSLIASHARSAGVHHITISPFCTRHDNHLFFSHRAGDAGRQIAVLARG